MNCAVVHGSVGPITAELSASDAGVTSRLAPAFTVLRAVPPLKAAPTAPAGPNALYERLPCTVNTAHSDTCWLGKSVTPLAFRTIAIPTAGASALAGQM